MKRLLKLGAALAAGLAITAFAPKAEADQFGPTSLCQTNGTGGTNLLNGTSGTMAVAGGAATNLYISIPKVAKYRYISVFFASKQMSGTAADVNVCHLDFSPDGSTTNWMNLADISNTAATTTIVKGNTNLDLPSIGYVRVAYITNACATIMTNVSLTVTYKPSLFGD